MGGTGGYGDDGGGESGGMGGTGSGGNGGSSGDDGPHDLTPIGGGDPGSIDFIDVSYYLVPVKSKDNISKPYDGMQAVDSNGVVYTYNAELNAWLLPDLQVLVDDGFEIDLYPEFDGIDLDGSILSTMVLVAVVEPTPIGEIIVGSAILAIIIYNAALIDTSDIDDSTRDHCTTLFVQCTTTYGYKNMPCATCQQYCNTQGEWDFLNCPLRP